MRENFQIPIPSSFDHDNAHSLNADGSAIAIAGEEHDIFLTDWNLAGDTLVIIYENYDKVALWYKSSAETYLIDVGFKDPSFFLWSPKNDTFILGTKKGNLVIYDILNDKVDTILGKHSKEITCGTWTDDDMLVLGSNDKTISFSSRDGQTIQSFSLMSNPKTILHTYHNDRCFISVNLDSDVWFYDASNPLDGVQKESKLITFPPEVGRILCHFWQPDGGSIIISTTCGRFICQPNPLLENMDDDYHILEYSVQLGRICKCCVQLQSFVVVDDQENIRLLWYRDKSLEEHTKFSIESVQSLNMSRNGDVLLVCTPDAIHGILLHATNLHCSYGADIAFISSHREITMMDDQGVMTQLKIDQDPDLLGLGPHHMALGSRNELYIYDRDLNVRENKVLHLVDHAKDISMNSKYLAVRAQTTIYIHELGGQVAPLAHACDEGNKHASCLILTQDFLIYGTIEGDICFLYLESMEVLCDIGLKHKSPIIEICSNDKGSIVAFVDGDGKGFMYDTFSQELILIPAFPPSKKMMWDESYGRAFHVFDGQQFHTFVIYLASIRGSQVVKFGDICIGENGEILIAKTRRGCVLGNGVVPILCRKGEITCQSSKDGSLVKIASDTFTHEYSSEMETEQVYSSFSKYLVLNYLEDACKSASYIKSNSVWRALGNKAIEMMDIPIAIFAFQKLREVAIVARLEQIQYIEEKNLLSGHLAVLFGDYDLAESKFLKSSSPSEALEMRCNFGHWNEALSLATEYFSDHIKSVSIALANELELNGDFKTSLEVLEQALEGRVDKQDEDDELRSMIAKTSLKLGNRKKALYIANELRSPLLYCDLAMILESQNEQKAAAELFESGQQISEAIRLWMKEKNLERVTQLIHTSELLLDPIFYNEYALLCESYGNLDLAVEAYVSADNIEDALRLCLAALGDSTRALKIMRHKPLKSAALGASELCLNNLEYPNAIEFLILGEFYSDAFNLATTVDCVDTFVSLIGDKVTSTLAEDIGSHYESIGNSFLAAKFFVRSPKYLEKALNLFVQNDSVSDAIQLAEGNNDLAAKLILRLKEDDNVTVEQKINLHQLYLYVNDWDEALSIGYAIVVENMTTGDYVTAYNIASKTMTKLDPIRVLLPLRFRSLFNILHTYHLAKKFVKSADHDSAAPLLARVSESVNLFAPADHLNLLISTVIECNKCELHQLAFKYSKIICADKKLKNQLDKSPYKRKIQSIIRRSQKKDYEVKESPYDLPSEDNSVAIPICICSGMFLDSNLDWTFCPKSGMPALLTKYIEFANMYGSDPINGEVISSSDLVKASIEEVNEYTKYNNQVHS